MGPVPPASIGCVAEFFTAAPLSSLRRPCSPHQQHQEHKAGWDHFYESQMHSWYKVPKHATPWAVEGEPGPERGPPSPQHAATGCRSYSNMHVSPPPGILVFYEHLKAQGSTKTRAASGAGCGGAGREGRGAEYTCGVLRARRPALHRLTSHAPARRGSRGCCPMQPASMRRTAPLCWRPAGSDPLEKTPDCTAGHTRTKPTG